MVGHMSAVDDKERSWNLDNEDIEVCDSFIKEACGGAARNPLQIRIEKSLSNLIYSENHYPKGLAILE